MAITKRMKEIALAYEAGDSLEELAEKYGITTGSVKKKIDKYDEHLSKNPLTITSKVVKKSSSTSKSIGAPRSWTDDLIRQGVMRYIEDNGVMPSASNFDECAYLPSARQVQRQYGGVVALRKQLGYGDIDFTRGELRQAIVMRGNVRGLEAEERFEELLLSKFGEPFVHTQKRYSKGTKNRYDFFIYAKDDFFGIDIFAVDKAINIGKNIRHKVQRYKGLPTSIKVYFVLVGDFSINDLHRQTVGMTELKLYTNMIPIREIEFLEQVSTMKALMLPDGFRSTAEQ